MTQSLAIEADLKSRDLVATLALIYLRHGQPERALPLTISAMAMGPPPPQLALCAASAFLACENPEQAEAVLSRFWSDQPLLDGEVTETHLAAAHSLKAKVAHRLGDFEHARQSLKDAAALSPKELQT